MQTQINQNLTEIKSMQGQAAYKEAKRSYQDILEGAERDLKKVEKEIKAHIKSDKELQRLHDIITSVDGGIVPCPIKVKFKAIFASCGL